MSDLDQNKRVIGRTSSMSVAIQNTTNDPATSTLFPLGAVTTKGFNIDGNVIEANDSFNSSGFTENQLASSSFTISVSGNYVRDPDLYPNFQFINQLLKHRFAAGVDPTLSTSPVILVEYKRADITLTAYMIINSINVDDPDSDLSTFTMELSNATSPTYPPALTDTETE